MIGGYILIYSFEKRCERRENNQSITVTAHEFNTILSSLQVPVEPFVRELTLCGTGPNSLLQH